MKRKSEDNPSATFGNILTAASPELRAWIGAVVLAYNETQSALHVLAAKSLAFTVIGQSYAVTSRIYGTDGLIHIIKQSVAALQFPPEQTSLFNAAISEEGFANLKKLRDAVIHAELSDSGTEMAIAPGAKGARQEVFLSPIALRGLYERLVFLKRELAELGILIECQKMLKGISDTFRRT